MVVEPFAVKLDLYLIGASHQLSSENLTNVCAIKGNKSKNNDKKIWILNFDTYSLNGKLFQSNSRNG